MNGKWHTHGERKVYESDWVDVSLVDVELPDGEHIDHHVVQPKSNGAAAVLAHVPEKGVLLIWRHRFITDTWTWEVPGGAVENNETPAQAGAREFLEETGWRPGKLKPLLTYQPMNGLLDHTFNCFTTDEATWEGPAADPNEAADIAWVSLPDLREIMRKGEMSDGFSLTMILWAMTFGPLQPV